MATVGGIHESVGGSDNSLHDIDGLVCFAVQEHSTKENALLEYGKVIKAEEQVMAGTLHHITMEVRDGLANQLYEAKVWVKPWINFKQLQEFKPVDE